MQVGEKVIKTEREREKERGAMVHRYDYATNYTGSENRLVLLRDGWELKKEKEKIKKKTTQRERNAEFRYQDSRLTRVREPTRFRLINARRKITNALRGDAETNPRWRNSVVRKLTVF